MCPEAPDDHTRCAECPLTKLEEALGGPAGDLLRRAVDLHFALQAGFNITLGDVTAEEFRALQLLKAARDKLEIEEADTRR